MKGRFLKKKGGSVTPLEVINLLEEKYEPPPFPEYVSLWQTSEKILKEKVGS